MSKSKIINLTDNTDNNTNNANICDINLENEYHNSCGENNIRDRIPLEIYNAGGGQAHNNMPPFYVLAYIMKL